MFDEEILRIPELIDSTVQKRKNSLEEQFQPKLDKAKQKLENEREQLGWDRHARDTLPQIKSLKEQIETK